MRPNLTQLECGDFLECGKTELHQHFFHERGECCR